MQNWFKARAAVRRFADDQGGALIVFAAAAIFMIMGIGALAVDMGYTYSVRTRLQTTADAAALAAIAQISDQGAATSTALAFAESNMPAAHFGAVIQASDVDFGTWNASTGTFDTTGTPADSVRVTAQLSDARGNASPLFFANIFGMSDLDQSVSAIATEASSSAPCVLALGTSADAIIVNSSSSITATGCSIQSNGGIDSNSGSTVTADSICAAGSATGSGYSPSPTACPPVPDPHASLTPPAGGGSCTTDKVVSGTETLSPGRYCGKLEVNSGGVAYLDPGIYYMDDAEFIANSGSTITGTYVMMFLTGSAGRLKVNSGGHVDLSAGTTGPYAGILIYQDQSVTPLVDQLINSDSSSILNGVVYLPQSHVRVNSFGTMTGSTGMQLVALKIEVISNSSITTTSTVAGGGGGGGATTSLVR